MKFARVNKIDGQKFLNLIKKHSNSNIIIINYDFNIEYKGDFIFFPLNSKYVENLYSIITDIQFEIVERNGQKKDIKPKNLIAQLKEILPRDILSLIPRSYDIIGDIAIVEFDRLNRIEDQKKGDYKKVIAKAILSINKAVKTIYEKKSQITGNYRLRDLKFVSGMKKSETTHKENSTTYKLDVKRVFFTPRLVFERKRISNLRFNKNELIVDMFAGVGPFSIQIAKNNQVDIYAFDINPVAIKYMKKNLDINNVKNQIQCFNLDVKKLIREDNEIGNKLKNKIDRIVMNLPEKSLNFIEVACFLSKKSGAIMHFYTFHEKSKNSKNLINKLSNHLERYDFEIESIFSHRTVKPYSPKMDLKVLDCLIKSRKN